MIASCILVFLLAAISFYLLTLPVRIRPNSDNSRTVLDPQSLKTHVHMLSTIQPARNYENIDSLDLAAEYIYAHFKQYCPETQEQKYITDAVEYKNLICRFPGVSPEKIIIGAHYDVAGEKPGADDNASGVAGLLELVKLTDEQNLSLPHTLEFVAYTLEEPPFFRTSAMGSAVHAKYQHDNQDKVKLMISLEMIGYFSQADNSQNYPIAGLNIFYPNRGNFISIVGKLDQFRAVRDLKIKMAEGSNIDVRSFSGPNIIPGTDFSDHLNYWNYGYNAVMVTDTAFFRNKNYHTDDDTEERLDYPKMAEVIRGVYWAIVNL